MKESTKEKLRAKNRCNGSAKWSGGHHLSSGYIKVKSHGHHRADRQGYVYEHILVVEATIGREISATEAIHHINGNRTDNRLENLYLFPSKSAHSRYHAEASTGRCAVIFTSNLG